MESKVCSKCILSKQLSEFGKNKDGKNGLKSVCKICSKITSDKWIRDNIDKVIETRKKWNINNIEKRKEYSSNWAKNNPEERKETSKKQIVKNKKKNENITNKDLYKEGVIKKCYRCKIEHPSINFNKNKSRTDGLSNSCKLCDKIKAIKYREENPEKLKKLNEYWRTNNPEKEKNRHIKYRKENPHIEAWRGILKGFLGRLGKKKEGHTIDLLGYSATDLKNHITCLFTEGMSWGNRSEWHIDHIIGICNFDKDELPSVVNALSNLRPLWKTSRIIDEVFYEGNLNRKKR